MQIQKTNRNSSLELFRILATFLVLTTHWNDWFLNDVTYPFTENYYIFRGVQIIVNSLTACCVNSFLLISGFFGIKLKIQSIVKLYCVILSIRLPLSLFNSILTHQLAWTDLLSNFECFTYAGYFIQGYLVLLFISPILNSFVEKYKENLWKWVLGFVLIEGWFSWLHEDVIAINNGYSVIHFALMYLVGRAVSLNLYKLQVYNKYMWIGSYFLCCAFDCFLFLLHVPHAMAYSNPVVIVSTICLFMPFTFRQYVSKSVNRIAKSTLAVYILQVSIPICPWLMNFDKQLLITNPYTVYLSLSIACIIAFFMFGIIYDKIMNYPQKVLSNTILQCIERTKNKYSK